MLKSMTVEQLAKSKKIATGDIELIEKVVKDYAEYEVKANALRDYLVQLFDEQGPDEREDLSFDAAGWSDGWAWALNEIINLIYMGG